MFGICTDAVLLLQYGYVHKAFLPTSEIVVRQRYPNVERPYVVPRISFSSAYRGTKQISIANKSYTK